MSPELTSRADEAVGAPRPPRRVVVIAWLLALVALLPPVTVLVLAWRILRGSLDDVYFGSYSGEDQGVETAIVPPGITFWDRWSVLSSAVPHEPALLTTTGVGALLAGLHLAGGSRWPLGRAPRWAAAGVAWLAAAMAAGYLGLTLVSARQPESERPYSFYYSSDLLTVLQPAVAMVVVLGFALVAGILLVGPAVPAPSRSDLEDPGEDEDDLEGFPVPAERYGAGPETPTLTATQAPSDPVVEPVAFPRPSAEEYAAYRRPAS